MDADTRVALKEKLQRADALEQHIRELKEALEKGRTCQAVQISFQPFRIDVLLDGERSMTRVCWASKLEERSETFRQAWLQILKTTLAEAQDEYTKL